MKILVTGANGLLGQHLVKPLLNAGHQVLASGKGPARIAPTEQDNYKYADADITDENAIEKLMNAEKPEVVIHAAAMTQVDICEQHRDRCSEVNVQGTANLLLHAEKHSSFIIYVSTDFVFDGEKGNYSEEDELKPVNWYGFTKMQAEGMIAACTIPSVIVRTCLVYGNIAAGARGNIISWVREKLANGEKIKVVDDQLRTPTYVEDLAKGILLIAEKNTTGKI
jgi:dTDP-4-dehydrorhamnose reductase